MILSMFAIDDVWRSLDEDRRNEVRAWLRDHCQADPCVVRGVTLSTEGVVTLTVFEIRRTNERRQYVLTRNNAPATYEIQVRPAVPPPWLAWRGVHPKSLPDVGSVSSTLGKEH